MLHIDDSTVRWIHKTAYKQHWRVSLWYDFDDLVQDGYMQYYRLLERYPDVTSRAHMMALFKRTYTNHIHDLSKHRTRAAEVLACDLADPRTDDQWLWDTIGAVDPDTGFPDLINDAPTPVQAVLRVFASDQGLESLRRVYRRRKDGTRETLNDRLCRLTGFKAGTDLAGLLHSYLTRAVLSS